MEKIIKPFSGYLILLLAIIGVIAGILFISSIEPGAERPPFQVWAGMAKETAHQLGTPVSSLEGWIEILRDTHGKESFFPEIEKDVSRLRLVSDRFGKIGSAPQLEEKNIIEQVKNMVEYIRKRAGGKVSFTVVTHGLENIPVKKLQLRLSREKPYLFPADSGSYYHPVLLNKFLHPVQIHPPLYCRNY